MKKYSRIVIGLSVFFSLLTLTEASVPSFLASVSEDHLPWDRVIARKEEVRNGDSYDVIALGDSTGVQGIFPKVFEEVTGLSMFNYATYSDRVALTDPYFLLEYLSNHPAPQAVIVIRSIHSWAEPLNKEYFIQHLPNAELAKILLNRQIISTTEYARSMAQLALPSLQHRRTVATMRTLSGNKKKRQEILLDRKLIPGAKGYEPFQSSLHPYRNEVTDERLASLRTIHDENGEAVINQDRLTSLQVLCEIGREYKVPIFILSGPYAQIVNEDPMLSSAVRQIEQTASDATDPYDNCAFVKSNHAMPSRYLSDLTHTDHEGAVLFTQLVAKEVINYASANLK